MRLFTLIDFRHFILAFFSDAWLLPSYIVHFVMEDSGGGLQKDDQNGPEADRPEFPEGLRIDDNPAPPVLIFVFLGFAVWFILYVVFFGIFGGPV